MNRHFDSFGGGIHHTAVIGQYPEDEGYEPGVEVFEPEIDPDARIEAFVTVDAGLEDHTYVGSAAWLLKHSHVGHDAFVGSGVLVATGAVIGGHAKVFDDAKIGLNAVVLPFRTVHADAEIGAGAVVTKDVPPGEVWAGNPARPMGPKNPVPYTGRGRVVWTDKQAGDYIRAHG